MRYLMGKNGRTIPIQVKTIREANSANKLSFVSESIETIINPFVYVWIRKDETIEIFVIPAKDIAEISKKDREVYIAERPHVSKIQPRMIGMDSLQPYKDRWDLLGLD